ncbi:MAG: hypothetical protein HYT37_03200 [Candidatus Sungbacteria bacterium]|nr:hypothetical protein [Candidatus Sungbacteria bacterium]
MVIYHKEQAVYEAKLRVLQCFVDMQEEYNKERFHPFAQKEVATPHDPGKEFQSFMEERMRLLLAEKEKYRGPDVPVEKVISALYTESEIGRLVRENPRLQFSVTQARWTGSFASMAERGNYYLKKTLAEFLFNQEMRKKINLGLAYHGVAGEVMARQVLEKSGVATAHARPELDAACGVDLLGYKKTTDGRELYFAIQVKTNPTSEKVRFEKLTKESMQALKSKAARSPDEEEIVNSGDRAIEAVSHMRRLSQKPYEPFLFVMPSIRVVHDMHAVNLGSFKLNPELVDKFAQNVLKIS